MSSDLNSTTPPKLASLQDYISGQIDRIKLLLNLPSPNFYFRSPDNEYWTGFWKSFWGVAEGKGVDSFDRMEEVERGLDTIDASLLHPDVVPKDRNVMTKDKIVDKYWYSECGDILIRSEYNKAEDSILSTCGTAAHGIVVAGQPGTGKSIFLLRLLLRRLALRLPTALQTRPDHAQLFYEGGVKEFGQVDNGPAYNSLESGNDPLGRIWVLVDSNEILEAPTMTFQEGPFFIVEVASPRPMSRDWTKRVRIEFFYMKPWSFSEVIQVRSLIKDHTNEKLLWDLHNKYGASPRDLFVFATAPDRYDDMINFEIDMLSPEDFVSLLWSANNVASISHYLISTEPLSTDRAKCKRKIASRHIFEQICKRVLEDRAEMKKFYDMFQNQSSTS